jgi:hypothetical protein
MFLAIHGRVEVNSVHNQKAIEVHCQEGVGVDRLSNLSLRVKSAHLTSTLTIAKIFHLSSLLYQGFIALTLYPVSFQSSFQLVETHNNKTKHSATVSKTINILGEMIVFHGAQQRYPP